MSIALPKSVEDRPLETSLLSAWAPSVASATMSTLSGAILGGVPGAALGLASSVFDEFLIQKGVEDKHNLTNAFFWKGTVITPLSKALSYFLPSYSLPISVVAHTVMGVALPYFSDDLFDYKAKLQEPIESFLAINQMFDEDNVLSFEHLQNLGSKAYQKPTEGYRLLKEYCTKLYENKFLRNFAKTLGYEISSLVITQLFLNFLASHDVSNLMISGFSKNQKFVKDIQAMFKQSGDNAKGFQKLKEFIYKEENWTQIQAGLISVSKILGGLVLKNKIVWMLRSKKHTSLKEQERAIVERCTRMMMENGNGSKILGSEEGRDIIHHMNMDFRCLMHHGSSKLANEICESTETLLCLDSINRIYQTALVPFIFTILPFQTIVRNAAEKIKEMTVKLSGTQTKLATVKADISQNLDRIELRNGSRYLEAQYSELIDKEHLLSRQIDFVKKEKENKEKLFELYNDFIGYGSYGAYVLANILDLSTYPVAKRSIRQLVNFAMSNAYLQESSKTLCLSMERVEKLFSIIGSNPNKDLVRSVNTSNQIVFKDYELRVGKERLMTIDSLVFEPGIRYAVTGKSGCGKTSMLKDVKKGLVGGIKSSGEISTPNKDLQSVMFLDQDLYFPKESTLFEILCFPKIEGDLGSKEKARIRKKTLKLFKELEIDSFSESGQLGLASLLDSKDFKLSGGQSKKIAIIQAILSQPSILIMDETFTGLDQKSLKLVERALRRYLPRAMIISVDHHADANHNGYFYQRRVDFQDHGVSVSDF